MNQTIRDMLQGMANNQTQKGEFGYEATRWRWEFDGDKLEFEPGALGELLSGHAIHGFTDFLPLLTAPGRKELLESLKRSLEAGTEEELQSALVTPESNTLIYCSWRFKKASENCLEGTVRPLLALSDPGIAAELFQQLFDNPHHGIVVTDSNTRVIACNRYFCQKTGYSVDELLGKKTSLLNAHKHSKAFFDEMWSQVHGSGFWSGTILTLRASGKTEPQELTIQKVELESGECFYIGYSVDLTNHLYRVADKELGGIEMLTQLPNQSQFSVKLLELVKEKHPLSNVIVMCFTPDLEGADELDLRMSLSGAVAQTEERYLCGYLKENLFAAALYCEKGPGNVRLIHNEIKSFFQSVKRHGSDEIYTRVINGRIGVSVLGYDTANPKSLVTHATQAMLEQHSSKGYNISFFDRNIHKEAVKRKKLEEALVQAIRSDALKVFYQPIVSTADWQVVKFEALCRFPELNGEVYPVQDVISLAEDLNLITSIDRCVGTKALKELPVIQKHFGAGTGLTINRSLNTKISAQQVLTNALHMIESSDVDPSSITIELTESAYFSSEESHIEALQTMRQRGVQIAIDDFGSGYSSFSYLCDGHFDYLKIDREFVKDIVVGSNRYFIVKNLVALSHTLGVTVVAEGAESIKEVEVLTGLGVDCIQGYYFSRPLGIEDIEKARLYTRNMKELRPLAVPSRGAGILTLCDFTVPALEPSTSLEEVRKIFSNTSFDALPVLDEGKCVGYVDRETYMLHLSPTLGTKRETQADLKILKRKVAQIQRVDYTLLSDSAEISQVSELVRRKAKLPWVINDELGRYIGIVSVRQLLDYYAK